MSQPWYRPLNELGSEEANNTTINTHDIWTTFCQHKLPCGYCSLMEKPCPMETKQYEITCETKGE